MDKTHLYNNRCFLTLSILRMQRSTQMVQAFSMCFQTIGIHGKNGMPGLKFVMGAVSLLPDGVNIQKADKRIQ